MLKLNEEYYFEECTWERSIWIKRNLDAKAMREKLPYDEVRWKILRFKLGFPIRIQFLFLLLLLVSKPDGNANSSGETRPSKSYTVVLNGIIPRDAEVSSRRLFSLPNKQIWHVPGSSPVASGWQKHRRCKSQWCPISGRQYRPTLIHRIPFYLPPAGHFYPFLLAYALEHAPRSCPKPRGFAENRKSHEPAYVYFTPFPPISLCVPPLPGGGGGGGGEGNSYSSERSFAWRGV